MNAPNLSSGVTTEPSGVGGAVGVGRRHWFVAIVNHNTEKKSAEKLAAMGYDCYVATQEEYRLWKNGRRTKIDRVVIPSMLFVFCTEKERMSIVNLPYIFRFLTNKAGTLNQYGRPVAIIPGHQMNILRFMLGNSDHPVNITTRPIGRGDKVRVTRGSLRGLEGFVIDTNQGRSELYVNLDILGCATVTINPIDVEAIT